LSIAEEHIASQAIRDSVIRLQGIIRLPRKKIGKALCLNFSNEFHSMALKMVSHILEIKGYKIFYTGQNTPMERIDQFFQNYRPDRVYISGTMVEDKQLLIREFKIICDLSLNHGSKLFIGGQAFDVLSIDHPVVVRRLMNFEDVYTY
jgi:methanogenic corrinoid protein MtbC1